MERAKEASRQELLEVISGFDFGGELEEVGIFGNGHINETYCAVFSTDTGKKKFILQKMNHQIFKDPVGLMENISGVTSWLKKKIQENGGDVERETLNIVNDREGSPYLVDKEGEYWRAYLFIEGATCFDQVENDEDFYQSALAFGNFQRLLSDYPAETLHETIPDFHNTVKRFGDFKKAVAEDACGRAADVQKEIQFVLEREQLAHTLVDLQKAGKLPLRVTHNDTKLNNIMIDDVTHKGICVIDLDTVMPGLSLNDFGDSIRFGANTAEEDETDLTKVSLSVPLFEIYTRGFLEGCAGSLTEAEVKMLPQGARLMTLECGIRFLTDYLSGDTYFKIAREKHNLDRCRTQLGLVEDMEKKWGEMERIVEAVCKG